MPSYSEARFSKFLKVENIVCDLAATGWKEAIAELAGILHKNEDGFDKDAVIEACVEREKACSTVIAPRLALPHARVDDLASLIIGIGTSPRGIPFLVQDRGMVNAIFLILTPTAAPGLYLQALAALTRELDDPGALDRLVSCKSPEGVYQFFSEGTVALPPYLKAQNLMEPHPPTLLESDDLKKTIELFCSRNLLNVPVIDEEGDLRGTLSLEDLLRLSLPQHLLWMHDLSSILHFEPFAELLRHDKESKVADFMRDDYVTVRPDVPAVQLAKMFLTHEARQILVVDGRKLMGTVDIDAFIAKLLWA